VKGFEEHATDRRRLAAAESLARHAGVDYAVALRHLQNNTAKVLVEKRGRAPRRRSSRPGGLNPKQALLVCGPSGTVCRSRHSAVGRAQTALN
jgi:hypothetical protein